MRRSVVLPAPFGPSSPVIPVAEIDVDVGEGDLGAEALADARRANSGRAHQVTSTVEKRSRRGVAAAAADTQGEGQRQELALRLEDERVGERDVATVDHTHADHERDPRGGQRGDGHDGPDVGRRG